ncbi:hypothetical protein LXL04_024514 [Taraxacum kok-saghyz]
MQKYTNSTGPAHAESILSDRTKAAIIHRRRKQRIWSKSETPDYKFSVPESSRKTSDYACEWDPTQTSPKTCGFCVESNSLQSFNLEEIESATRKDRAHGNKAKDFAQKEEDANNEEQSEQVDDDFEEQPTKNEESPNSNSKKRKNRFDVLGSFENSYIPENPRTTKPLTFSKNRLRVVKNRSNTRFFKKKFEKKRKKENCTYAKIKKIVFSENFFATGLVFERFLSSQSRFFEKVNGLGVLGLDQIGRINLVGRRYKILISSPTTLHSYNNCDLYFVVSWDEWGMSSMEYEGPPYGLVPFHANFWREVVCRFVNKVCKNGKTNSKNNVNKVVKFLRNNIVENMRFFARPLMLSDAFARHLTPNDANTPPGVHMMQEVDLQFEIIMRSSIQQYLSDEVSTVVYNQYIHFMKDWNGIMIFIIIIHAIILGQLNKLVLLVVELKTF